MQKAKRKGKRSAARNDNLCIDNVKGRRVAIKQVLGRRGSMAAGKTAELLTVTADGAKSIKAQLYTLHKYAMFGCCFLHPYIKRSWRKAVHFATVAAVKMAVGRCTFSRGAAISE